jgi:transposase
MADDLARYKNRLGKALTEAGIRLHVVVRDIHGQTARAMIRCLIDGGTPEEALQFATTRLKAPKGQLLLALEGHLTPSRRSLLKSLLKDVTDQEAKILDKDNDLLSQLAPYQDELDLLQTIPGLGRIGAAMLLAEIGPDMVCFKSASHIASSGPVFAQGTMNRPANVKVPKPVKATAGYVGFCARQRRQRPKQRVSLKTDSKVFG